jgi:undecaprenyl phosphate-alpha-L-ara4N flippase subunit ArnE
MLNQQGLTWPVIGLTVGTIALLACGQVLFKVAAASVQPADWRTWLSPALIAALALYGVGTIAWLLVLARIPLSVAFPFYGLSFVFVPVLAWSLLREPVRMSTIAGSLLIIAGVIVCSRRW